MPDSGARGRFVWHDLMTPDPAGAIAFYTKVAGWSTDKWKGPNGSPDYTMWSAGTTMIGGVMKMPPNLPAGVPPHWIAYVCVDDTDASAKKAKELGGNVVTPPTDIPTVGRFAVIADPQGATIALFTPAAQAPGHDGPSTQGEFSWHELTTTDYAAAFKFYSALFGWEKDSEMDMGPMGVYLIYGRNGKQLGGMFNKPPEMPFPPNWLLYVQVDNADKAAERVTKNGGKILNGPMDVPGGGRIAQCIDPQGAAFAVHSVEAAS